VNFGAIGRLDYVTVGYHTIEIDEETAAARNLFTTRVKRLDCHCRRFNPAHQIRQ
jgi:hypothetical protein